MTPPPHERGFVLVSAMWLLILCGAIAAVLIVRARTSAATVSAAERAYHAELQRHDAIEVIIADLLFAGPRSRWAVLPAEGAVAVDGTSVPVTVTSEAGRLDLNSGDLTVIAGALQGLGVPPRARGEFIGELARHRADKHLIASQAEVDALVAKVAAAPCLANFMTISSGLQRPRETDLTPELARALGVVQVAAHSPIAPGSALRIIAGDGSRMRLIVRITGGAAAPYLATDLTRNQHCVDEVGNALHARG